MSPRTTPSRRRLAKTMGSSDRIGLYAVVLRERLSRHRGGCFRRCLFDAQGISGVSAALPFSRSESVARRTWKISAAFDTVRPRASMTSVLIRSPDGADSSWAFRPLLVWFTLATLRTYRQANVWHRAARAISGRYSP